MCNYYVITCTYNLFVGFFSVCVLVTSVTVKEPPPHPQKHLVTGQQLLQQVEACYHRCLHARERARQ